jgi:ABC-type bacteriocin/lantibiotic exporter with double-glycine peptidase domain
VITAPTLGGRIELQSVTFGYAPGGPPVIQDVSTRIESGQLVAIVGPSGAGKSTLANLMLGLLRPTRGQILFDGLDLASLESRSVRSQLGVVLQHTHLFGTTIRDNIALGDPSLSLDEIERAARLAHVHSDIMAMPLRYDTLLSDGGLSLSGGQRQRIALARALARRPVILLLDEATNALDSEIEQRIQASIAELGCTRIVIAHRLSTIRHADLILALEHGRVVEAGTHEQLARAGGTYDRLVQAQAGGARAGDVTAAQ